MRRLANLKTEQAGLQIGTGKGESNIYQYQGTYTDATVSLKVNKENNCQREI